MKIKTSRLEGAALDYAVAVCEEDAPDYLPHYVNGHPIGFWNYSSDWSQGGPIIERERIEVVPSHNGKGWDAYMHHYHIGTEEGSKTALQAAMRCYVASRCGDTVEVPDELI